MRFMAFCAISFALLVAVTAMTLKPGRTLSETGSEAAQVTLDGVPVCVFRHVDRIIAVVGRCGVEVHVPTPSPSDQAAPPGQRLPPGHPPIDGPDFGQEGRVLI